MDWSFSKAGFPFHSCQFPAYDEITFVPVYDIGGEIVQWESIERGQYEDRATHICTEIDRPFAVLTHQVSSPGKCNFSVRIIGYAQNFAGGPVGDYYEINYREINTERTNCLIPVDLENYDGGSPQDLHAEAPPEITIEPA